MTADLLCNLARMMILGDPRHLSRDLVHKIMIDNPRNTYSRLTETIQ
jgi:hypothetical protein